MPQNHTAWLQKLTKLKTQGTGKTTVQDMLDAPHGAVRARYHRLMVTIG